MKTKDDLKLLDAVLADEDWTSCSAESQAVGLASLRARRKTRARLAFAAQVFAALVLAAVGYWTLAPKHLQISQNIATSTPTPLRSPTRSEGDGQRLGLPAHSGENLPDQSVASDSAEGSDPVYISEEQMLKMFPDGSCLIAEVNGEKRVIVLANASQPTN